MAAAREAAIADARQRLADLGDDDMAGMFEAALVGGNMMVYRERAKTTLVRVLHEVRMAARELGRRHAEAGTLSDPDHIFMLTESELDGFVADPGSFRETLAQRMALLEEQLAEARKDAAGEQATGDDEAKRKRGQDEVA